MNLTPQFVIDASYFAAAFLFIYGLKRMSSPVTARSGIVVVGAMYALLNASSLTEQIIGTVGVFLGAMNAAGGYVVTERMLEMFKPSDKKKA